MHSGNLPKLRDAAAIAEALLAVLEEHAYPYRRPLTVLKLRHSVLDEDHAGCDEEVMLEDNKIVGLINEDCLAFGNEVIVEDNKFVVGVREEGCLMFDEEAILEDNKVVGVHVVLLKIAVETAQEYISVGMNRLSCSISNMRINSFNLGMSRTYQS